MRIVSGKHRGKVLAGFKGTEIRPTSDRAKEALFNILQTRIVGSIFYDAFCGTGSIGIEAISRGAKQVVFTDISKDSVQICKKNLASISNNSVVENVDAVSFLKKTSLKFDVVFLDPPYNSNQAEEAMKIILLRNLLLPDGIVVYEHKKGDNRHIDGFLQYDSRTYGIAQFDFYKVIM